MEASDVKAIRALLRKVTYKKTVTVKETGEQKEVVDNFPISVELDNSLALSEKTDIVMWDDTKNIIYAIMFNSNVVKGSDLISGRAKPVNPGALIAADYGEIQQFRIEINEDGMDKFMKEFKSLGVKINSNGKEVVIDDAAITRAKNFIHGQVDPMNVFKKDQKLGYL